MRRASRWIGILPAILLGVMAWRRRWVCDDAFIDFRVVENWIAGYGPVFNRGERVEAYTNPAWVALLALWRELGGRIELGSVVLGLAFAVLGAMAGYAAAAALAHREIDPPRRMRERPRAYVPVRERLEAAAREHRPAPMRPAPFVLPLGALVFAVLPPVWDFSTSGLEMGLAFAWMGATYWMLVRALTRPVSPDIPWKNEGEWQGLALLIGLGPLIRPDLAILCAAFLGALMVGRSVQQRQGLPSMSNVRILAWASMQVLAYQVFRMGYFAGLVPNSALAKEPGIANWERGWTYARDFAGTYALWLPLALVVVAYVFAMRRFRAMHDRCTLVLVMAPAAGALLYALFVIRMGGDFMHGRLLLPALWAALLPVAAVPIPIPAERRWDRATGAAWIAVALVVGWAVVCGTSLRVHYREDAGGPAQITDERAFYTMMARRPNPVRSDDYAAFAFARDGAGLRKLASSPLDSLQARLRRGDGQPGAGAVLLDTSDSPQHQARPDGAVELFTISSRLPHAPRLVVGRWNVGLTGYVAGPEVHVVDRHGVADPVAARLRLQRHVRPGHDKMLSNAWILARFSDVDPKDERSAEVRAAHQALACRPLAQLLRAVQGPITPELFVENLRLAPRLHRLRIPPDPFQAERELCVAPPP